MSEPTRDALALFLIGAGGLLILSSLIYLFDPLGRVLCWANHHSLSTRYDRSFNFPSLTVCRRKHCRRHFV